MTGESFKGTFLLYDTTLTTQEHCNHLLKYQTFCTPLQSAQHQQQSVRNTSTFLFEKQKSFLCPNNYVTTAIYRPKCSSPSTNFNTETTSLKRMLFKISVSFDFGLRTYSPNRISTYRSMAYMSLSSFACLFTLGSSVYKT